MSLQFKSELYKNLSKWIVFLNCDILYFSETYSSFLTHVLLLYILFYNHFITAINKSLVGSILAVLELIGSVDLLGCRNFLEKELWTEAFFLEGLLFSWCFFGLPSFLIQCSSLWVCFPTKFLNQNFLVMAEHGGNLPKTILTQAA